MPIVLHGTTGVDTDNFRNFYLSFLFYFIVKAGEGSKASLVAGRATKALGKAVVTSLALGVGVKALANGRQGPRQWP